VYLTAETDGELREDFRTKALVVGGVVVALSTLAIPLAAFEASHLFHALLSARALPVVVAGVAAALLSGYALLRRRWRLARASAIAQVGLLLVGWGVAQYPYFVYPDVTVASASVGSSSQGFMLGSLPFGALILGPSMWFLFRVFKSRPAT
jgi:cytochrome d ubiquinol oxidase subunit II